MVSTAWDRVTSQCVKKSFVGAQIVSEENFLYDELFNQENDEPIEHSFYNDESFCDEFHMTVEFRTVTHFKVDLHLLNATEKSYARRYAKMTILSW